MTIVANEVIHISFLQCVILSLACDPVNHHFQPVPHFYFHLLKVYRDKALLFHLIPVIQRPISNNRKTIY